MEAQKIQLLHPRGKKAVRINGDTYARLKTAIIQFLSEKTEATFSEMTSAIERHFVDEKMPFEGSLTWYLEWVKLDLEARHLIARVPKTSPQLYVLSKG